MDEAQGQLDLGIPTIVCEGKAYKISGIVTGMEGNGAELINWHRDGAAMVKRYMP